MAKPVPEPDVVSAFYWAAAREERLEVLGCRGCGHLHHPPDVACPRCLSQDLAPVPVSGRGSVYTFTVARQPFDAAFSEEIPYVLALVELEEQEGLRVLTNIVGPGLDRLAVGSAVEVVFEERDGWRLPQFRLARVAGQ